MPFVRAVEVFRRDELFARGYEIGADVGFIPDVVMRDHLLETVPALTEEARILAPVANHPFDERVAALPRRRDVPVIGRRDIGEGGRRRGGDRADQEPTPIDGEPHRRQGEPKRRRRSSAKAEKRENRRRSRAARHRRKATKARILSFRCLAPGSSHRQRSGANSAEVVDKALQSEAGNDPSGRLCHQSNSCSERSR